MTESSVTTEFGAASGRIAPGDGASWGALQRRSTRKVSHLLAEDLRRQILSGQLAPDQQLPPEADLTTRWQVSRETLREALRILESQQLIEIRRGRAGGAVVRTPGLEAVSRYVALLLQLRRTTLADLEEARSVIEPPAAQQAAVLAEADDLDALVALHEAERAADGPLGFVAAMTAFDQAVTELSGNRTVAVIAGVFRDIHAGQVYSSIGSDDGAAAERIAKQVIGSHSAFLAATRSHDASLARQTWIDYLVATNRILVSRNLSRQPIDITPMWRAQAGQAGSATTPRLALTVATEMRARIAEGRLGDGDRLPPLADVSEEFGISRPTLREALRILETESLLELRTGDRGGAVIRTPSTRVAAQLAGIVLEARGVTFGDFSRATQLFVPPIMGLVASRITRCQLGILRRVESELTAATEDTARFITTWREGEMTAFSAVGNPALTVIAEIMHWVRIGVEPAVTADATGLPWVSKTNRNAQRLFARWVSAAAAKDSAGASAAWAENLKVNASWFENSGIGERLVLDLMG
ncbi:FadR/GntR family transcriptional regulator [Mycolicibacterium palauense]|uniref:FadR/GntR family transcriptional regulator n=1 Tax=Mycolicibacterium palauense TaxID=2034511 RepID=UPI000BFEEFBD|nr:GntR family transcriptional regulator [Mycolicibacterium palauense]